MGRPHQLARQRGQGRRRRAKAAQRRREFANPTWYPDLHRRQVIEAIRRASPGLNPPHLTLVRQAEAPNAVNVEGLSTTPDADRGNGRFDQSA